MYDDVPREAIDLMALNRLESIPWRAPRLEGLRSAVAVVIDAAARHQGTSRADALARMWPRALEYASRWPTPAEGDRRRLAEFMDCYVDRRPQDHRRVRVLVRDLARPRTGTRPARAPQALVRLLAGALPWLPLLRDAREVADMADLTVLPVGLLLMDALAERGLDSTIHDDGGRAVEHVSVDTESCSGVYTHIGVCTQDENVSRTPAASVNVIVEYLDADGDDEQMEYGASPVTLRHIDVVADAVADLARTPSAS
ncbi:hypothetical protein ACOQFV_24015 [Nocardiopsis changdeensis]|uniref:Uncharacterized protein n=1 Tax=Nocardiopsis changdeensis TaxID=2831969 RepID=A0A975KSH5_9ACTN|nr:MULTISPECIES: hypothetical protein [Nocardiopsis]QUX26539.1 hypothetical protein KGD84_33105 [Nocardiopsis changdeensis]QYX40658.1 hypothetical protein K1J57_32175 [Nocardiopsis sp. MT53]